MQTTCRVLLILAVSLCSGFARSASNAPYKLILDETPSMCKAILKIYNEDMASSGRINYGKHEMFTRIHWQEIEMPERGSTHGCERYSKATFDMDNDGGADLVIKRSACFRSNPSDSLFVYPAESNVLSIEKGRRVPLADTQKQFDTRAYTLSRVSGQSQKPIIGGIFVLEPFIWEKAAYLSITDMHQEWIAIATYGGNGAWKDVCYFHVPDKLKRK